MKKNLPIIALALLTACTSPKGPDPVSLTEAWLKEQMKDPSSFQVIKASIFDTTMMRQWLQDRYKDDTAMIAKTVARNTLDLEMQHFEPAEAQQKVSYEKLLQQKVDIYRESADKELQAISKLKQDSIFFITVRVEYRAKNGFGALDKESKFVNYYPSDTTFKIQQ